jgi:regulator of protease activity HflC (stomatin/prohibitin superfamily)
VRRRQPDREVVDVGWIVFLAIAIPLLAVVAWVVFDDSFVQIEPGQLGLLLVRGKATDRALQPGPHWVPALRRRMVQVYPSLELSFRAALTPPAATATSELERSGPAPQVLLGDRNTALVAYTVRFRLDPASLHEIHDRFGPEGIWTAVQDATAPTVRATLAQPTVGVDDLFGPARADLEARLGEEVTAVLAACGLVVTMFALGDVDLGQVGDVIEATARARHELAREQAEAPTRVERARIDADLAPYLGEPTAETALRYRELDSWQALARHTGPIPPAGWGAAALAAAPPEPVPETPAPETAAQEP